ncbi:phosphopantetheine-binding protein [Nocardia aurantiaca]|uniref:Acyl carrier protein n=1 Tax=Nocardia aurantiaca TaxID=2675850 RepID=A0A6I3KX72_9NOCA|nr:phosphopantetheine-binding protein [Nocardia aurantiaca]MTE14277.1 acyl carrier protein [Nocardia aurantiaca]
MAATLSRDVAEGIVRGALHGFDTSDRLAALPTDAPLRETLALDSLDFLTFVERLAAACDRRIEESDYRRLTTIATCVQFLTE